MYCKKCGRALESMSSQCPYCQTEISYEGGNGFWDLAGRPAPDGAQLQRDNGETLAALGRIERLLAAEKQKKAMGRLSLLATLCLLLSVLALLLTALSLRSLRKQLADVENGVSLLVTEARATPAPTVEPTPSPTAEPTPSPTAEPTPSPTAEPTPSPAPDITKQPTAEIRAPGWGGTIFEVRYIAPEGAMAVWQRRLADGEPETLTPEDLMILGLTAETLEEADSIKAVLRTDSLLAASAGEYRLVVQLPGGGTLETDWAKLMVMSTETSEALPVGGGDET